MKRIFPACLFDFLNLDPTKYLIRNRLSLVMYYLTKYMFYSDIVFVTYFVNLQDWRHRICVLKEKKKYRSWHWRTEDIRAFWYLNDVFLDLSLDVLTKIRFQVHCRTTSVNDLNCLDRSVFQPFCVIYEFILRSSNTVDYVWYRSMMLLMCKVILW